MRVAFVQTSPVLGRVQRNLEEAFALIEKVHEADLVVLPELFHSGYAVRSRTEADSLAVPSAEPSEPLEMCLDAARKFRMSLVAGFLERDEAGKLYNSAWLVSADGVKAKYRKVHLFDREKDIFEKGTDPSPIVWVSNARVGMQICFDWIFPEPWGLLAWGEDGSKGAEIIAHPANLVIPDACPLVIRARALENRIFIITAGRVGADPGPMGEIVFHGGSQIVAPDGTVLAKAPEDRTACELVTIDPTWADDKFVTPRNHVLKERFAEKAVMEEVEDVSTKTQTR